MKVMSTWLFVTLAGYCHIDSQRRKTPTQMRAGRLDSEEGVGRVGPSWMKMWLARGAVQGQQASRGEEYPHRSQCPPNSLPISLKISLLPYIKQVCLGPSSTYLHVPPRAHGLHMGWPCKQAWKQSPSPESRPASHTCMHSLGDVGHNRLRSKCFQVQTNPCWYLSVLINRIFFECLDNG